MQRRYFSLDLLRGLLIFTMMLAHTAAFLHTGASPVITGLRWLGDFVSFSGLLFISAAVGFIAYIHQRHTTLSVAARMSRRLLVYLGGYYLLAGYMVFLDGGLNFQAVFEILLFLRLVPFTEFIPTLILFALLKIPFRSFYNYLSVSLWRLVPVAGFSFWLSSHWYGQFPLSIPPGWQALLVGYEGFYSFPLLAYLPIYLLGNYIGRLMWEEMPKPELIKRLGVLALGGLILIPMYFSGQIFFGETVSLNRWPPNLAFIGGSLALPLLGLMVFKRWRNLTNLPWTRTALLLLGQNAFALFFTHTFLVFSYSRLGLPLVHGGVFFGLLFLVMMLTALYLARILPLNYKFTLTSIAWCECQLGRCTHAKEHARIRQLKEILLSIINVPNLFSVKVGKRSYKLFRSRYLIPISILMLVAAAPLGLAEEQLVVTKSFEEIKGQTSRQWFILDRDSQLEYRLNLPEAAVQAGYKPKIEYKLGRDIAGEMKVAGEGEYAALIDLAKMAPGVYELKSLITVNKTVYETLANQIYITEPLMVTWTIDWEGYDTPNSYLQAMDRLAGQFKIPMTHLFNPRIYFSEEVLPHRAEMMTEYVKGRARDFNEEIGLHLHMFPDMVLEAGLEPRLEPVWGGGFTPGYDILTSAYPYDEMRQILDFSINIFQEKGLGRPVSYRAGAWFASIETLRALEDSGFLVDSSGRTAYTFGTNRTPGLWDLSETSQPYFPSIHNQNSDRPPPGLSILEVPNNGGDDYAYSAVQMMERFNLNYHGGFLPEFKVVTYLTHPHWFTPNRQAAMNQVFSHTNSYAYEEDKGPVIYATLKEVYQTAVK